MSEDNRVSKLAWRWQAIDYGFLMPLLAKLPYALAHKLAMLRGALHARYGRDWAELSVGIRYIAERTANAAVQLWPKLKAADIVEKRYQAIAIEEWHGNILARGSLRDLHCNLDSLQHMLSKASPQKGLVVLTAHFDSFIVGMVGLGLCGRKTSVTTSNIYEHEQVHPAVGAFFERKYRGAETFLNGGKFMHVETSLRAFYRALLRKETVVVVADLPATQEGSGVCLPWLGQSRKVANGGFRMAVETDSQICAMVCITNLEGEVSWLCSDVFDPETSADYETQLFQFFEKCILENPGKWWASHLLQDYPVQALESAND
jgi:lauroyl/myristoyl acyltransferase